VAARRVDDQPLDLASRTAESWLKIREAGFEVARASFKLRGTEGSKPVPSSGESIANLGCGRLKNGFPIPPPERGKGCPRPASHRRVSA
jgi:hypothetical protein